MAPTWRFYPQQATDPIHNPISGEFFSTEAVGNVVEGLVREGIQNTLDARIELGNGRRGQARVRIFVSESAGSLPAALSRRWFASLWPHVVAPSNGLRDQPAIGDPCPFLVFEDFGTTGLTGDVSAHTVSPGSPNNFLNFFRAEGHSDKGEKDRGSWGVGKTVFPRASRISSFMGLTVRESDGARLLLGHSVLKYHAVGADHFKSNGYFGVERRDGFILPTDEFNVLADFSRDFHISRRDEAGLSIVVPWYETEGDDCVTKEGVLAAVLRGFFFPILKGHLSVIVETPDSSVSLDANSLTETVEKLRDGVGREMLPIIKLAEWATQQGDAQLACLDAPDPDRAQQWADEIVPADVLKKLRESLGRSERLALRLPIWVQPRSSRVQKAHFDIFIEGGGSDRAKPLFIRDELIISDVKSPKLQAVRALVLVENGPLATLLRDAETPAHTQWNQDTSHFKNKYKFGTSVINFVRLAPSELLRIVNQSEQQPDPSITIDFFSIAADDGGDEETDGAAPEPDPGPGPIPGPTPIPQPKPKRFRIDRLQGGFAIRPGSPEAAPPSGLLVRAAYDVRKGNPLKKYHPADFDFGRRPIQISATAVEVKEAAKNRLVISILDHDFSLEVTGLDADRDLFIKAEAKEADDVD